MPKKTAKGLGGDDRRRMPTQLDIARAAGVSQVTVSQALSGRGRVGEASSARVLEIARSLGYRPNAAARAISTGRFGCVALLLGVRQQTSHLPQELVWGIEDALEERDLYLLLARFDDQRLACHGYIPKVLRTVHADGMLINYTHWHPPELLAQVEAYQLPAVWINTKRAQDCVYPDEFGAARIATERLLLHGHRRIAYIDFSQERDGEAGDVHFSTIDRYAGYAHAMTLAGLQPRRVNGDLDSARVAWTRRWLSGPDRPTAILAFDPHSSRPVLMAAIACGLTIPTDLSVIVFDEQANHDCDVALTTVVTPDKEIGRMGVEMLLERLQSSASGLPSRAVPLQLIDGRSLATVPASHA